jgi:RNA polymerase sigma-70 factor (ECF subfamily)
MEMPKLMLGRQVGWRSSRPARSRLVLVDRMSSEPPSARTEFGDFGEVAENHRALLHRVALRLSGDPEVAKDLVQETLLRGLRGFEKLRPGTNVGAWLVTILTNLFYDNLKHQKVITKAEPDLVVLKADDIEYDSIFCRIADADLYAAVEALEPELREVVELCYLQQKRYHEAAAILNVPAGTIGTRLMRARVRLRALLDPASLRVVKP